MSDVRTKESIEADWKVEEASKVKGLLPLYRTWAKCDTWNLKLEALPLLYGIDPTHLVTFRSFPLLECRPEGLYKDRDDLTSDFLRAVTKFELPVTENSSDDERILVRPGLFAAYLLKCKIPYHAFLIESIKTEHEIPQLNPAHVTEKRYSIQKNLERILDAGYPITRIEAALAATVEHWLPYKPETGENFHKEGQIMGWIKHHYPSLPKPEIKNIDALIRHPSLKKEKKIIGKSRVKKNKESKGLQ